MIFDIHNALREKVPAVFVLFILKFYITFIYINVQSDEDHYHEIKAYF